MTYTQTVRVRGHLVRIQVGMETVEYFKDLEWHANARTELQRIRGHFKYGEEEGDFKDSIVEDLFWVFFLALPK